MGRMQGIRCFQDVEPIYKRVLAEIIIEIKFR